MVEKVSFSQADVMSAQELAAQFKNRATHQGAPGDRSGLTSESASNLIRTSTGFSGRVTGAGPVEDMRGATGTAMIVNDGNVELPGGIVTSKEVALANGWIKQDASGNLILADMDFAPEEVQRQQQNPVNREKDAEADETEVLNEKFAAADAALDLADRSLPQEVKTALTNAAVEGDLDVVEQMLGEQSFSAMVEGYTAYVDYIGKSDLGVDGITDLMSYVLDDAELSMARRAALFRDQQSLKYLAASTFKAMNDPSRNGDLIAAIQEAGGRVINKGNGTFAVNINGEETSIQDAFKRKLIRFS